MGGVREWEGRVYVTVNAENVGGSVYLCECETGVCRLYNVDIGTLV